MHAGESGLAELTERDSFVGLEALEPDAEIELMAAAGQADTILKGVEISGNGEIAAIVAAREAELGLRVRGGATTYDDCADWAAEKKSGNAGSGSTGSGLPGEEIAGAGKAKSRGVSDAK